jgi:hypothetical protein
LSTYHVLRLLSVQVLAVRPVYAETAVVVGAFKVYAGAHRLRLQLYLGLWLRLRLLLEELRHLAGGDLVHEELLRVVDVVARHEVRPLVKDGRLHVDLHHGHLLMCTLARLWLLWHTHGDVRHAREPREAKRRHHGDARGLIAEA